MHEYEQARRHLLTSAALESFVEGRAERLQAQTELGFAKNLSLSPKITAGSVTGSLEPSFTLSSIASAAGGLSSAAAMKAKAYSEAKTTVSTYFQAKERARATKCQVDLSFVCTVAHCQYT